MRTRSLIPYSHFFGILFVDLNYLVQEQADFGVQSLIFADEGWTDSVERKSECWRMPAGLGPYVERTSLEDL
jgi:hypothetical protein